AACPRPQTAQATLGQTAARQPPCERSSPSAQIRPSLCSDSRQPTLRQNPHTPPPPPPPPTAANTPEPRQCLASPRRRAQLSAQTPAGSSRSRSSSKNHLNSGSEDEESAAP